MIYSISGQLSYVNGASHCARCKKIMNFPCKLNSVVLNVSSLDYIDIDGIVYF